MKRVAHFPVAAALLLAFTPSAVAAPIQTFEGKASSSIAGEPANLALGGTTSMPDGSKPPIVKSIKITGPAGSKVALDVPTTCNRSTLETTGKCPSSSQVLLRGEAAARVDFGGLGTLPITGIKAYKLSGSGSNGTAVVDGTEIQTGVRALIDVNVYMSGSSPVLELPDTQLPTILGVVPVLMHLNVQINGKMKKGSGSKAKYLYRNPSKCPASGWTSTLVNTYDDGTSSNVTSTQKCKPAKKRTAAKKKKKRR